MLTLKDNLLSVNDISIDSADFVIQLQTDLTECTYFGLLTLNNSLVKTYQFVKINNIFKARIILTEEDLPYLQDSNFKVLSVSSNFTKESNLVYLNFDISKIKFTIKQSVSKEVSEMRIDLAKVKSKLESLALGKIVPNVNIVNKDYIKPGMVLVAIDNGNFMAAYPFINIITEVNGQQAIDGVVDITSSMIKYNTERTVEEQLKVLGDAVVAQNNSIKTLAAELKVLSERLATLSMKVETHLDSGII